MDMFTILMELLKMCAIKKESLKDCDLARCGSIHYHSISHN